MRTARAGVVRLVLDTNTVVSGYLWNGPPSDLIAIAMKNILTVDLFSSDPLHTELRNVITRQKFSKQLALKGWTAERLLAEYADRVRTVVPPSIPRTVLDDPDDDVVLATALACRAHLIVSGDEHLVKLGSFRHMRIVSSAEAVSLLRDGRSFGG
ncbi:MAG: putative toxin-antitoxin system toxin component, PIN family [Mitsuaria chitosanitabida]|jgi:putative PIN family toxin of toxin-antitoxin system|uniref:putative toxin-antitoxin system toxin component, PIN family n=1 Tax=Roseateles chitosanitabidus TaxID=65048 RepID=UPI001B21F607|nr:putative toxin-antitoxin system toxin component, PIN family [Roseateles chitosanitabidus]MBO9688367.1 putative toxin-antitoxin system toxin component, PIN family [Roseateles chitosanitabidus]